MAVVSSMYVLATPEGRYIHLSRSRTAVGYQEEAQMVETLEEASTFYSMSLPLESKAAIYKESPKTNWLPVRVTRTVELLGFGVEISATSLPTPTTDWKHGITDVRHRCSNCYRPMGRHKADNGACVSGRLCAFPNYSKDRFFKPSKVGPKTPPKGL